MAKLYQRTAEGVRPLYPETTADQVTTEDGGTVAQALRRMNTSRYGFFGMEIREDGHLYVLCNEDEESPPLSIVNGRLIYTL